MPEKDASENVKILIVGDGNLSFSLSLCRLYKARSPLVFQHFGIPLSSNLNIIATTFDSHQQLLEKYAETKDIIFNLQTFKFLQLVHEINAMELHSSFNEKFDFVVWNHPHLHIEDFKLHGVLLAHFFDSVSRVLTRQGQVVLRYFLLTESCLWTTFTMGFNKLGKKIEA